MPYACAALLPGGERVNVYAARAGRGKARLLEVWRATGRDVLPQLTDHARRMLRDQVESAMYAERQEGGSC